VPNNADHSLSWLLFALAMIFAVLIASEVIFGVSLSKFSFGRSISRAHAAERLVLPMIFAGLGFFVRAIENRSGE